MDGFSLDIILKDIQLIYAQLAVGRAVALLPKTVSFQKYTESILKYARESAPREMEYWLHLPWERVKSLPMDRPWNRHLDVYARIETVSMEFGIENTQAMLDIVKSQAAFDVQVKDFLLTALALAFRQWKDMDISWIILGPHGTKRPAQQYGFIADRWLDRHHRAFHARY